MINNIQRRTAIQLLLATAGAGLISACGSKDGQEKAAPVSRGPFLDAQEMGLIAALSQTIIPATQTGGAADAGVPNVIQELLSGWGDNELRNYWRQGLKGLNKHFLNAEGGGQFANLAQAKQEALLGAYDGAVFDGQIDDGFYKDFKNTIARAYYMSEIGASEELNYDPVPGDFLGDIPYADVGKAWAN